MFLVLQAWYDDYTPAKKRKSGSGRTTCVIQVTGNELAPLTFDDFADPLEDEPAAAAAAGGAAAVAAAALGPPGRLTDHAPARRQAVISAIVC